MNRLAQKCVKTRRTFVARCTFVECTNCALAYPHRLQPLALHETNNARRLFEEVDMDDPQSLRVNPGSHIACSTSLDPTLCAGIFITSTVEPLPPLPASTCHPFRTDLRGRPRAYLPSGTSPSVNLSWHLLVLVITSNSRSWLAFAADTTLNFDFAPTGIKTAVSGTPLRSKSVHRTPTSLALLMAS